MIISRIIQFPESFYLFYNFYNYDSENYWYDAAGERTVKESFDNEGVQVNGLVSAGRTGTTNFTTYISPYLVVRNGGEYTKHIYMGGQVMLQIWRYWNKSL